MTSRRRTSRATHDSRGTIATAVSVLAVFAMVFMAYILSHAIAGSVVATVAFAAAALFFYTLGIMVVTAWAITHDNLQIMRLLEQRSFPPEVPSTRQPSDSEAFFDTEGVMVELD